MTTKNKTNILNIERAENIGEHGFPQLMVHTRFGIVSLRPFSKTRAFFQTISDSDGNKLPLVVNRVEYDGQLTFTNGHDEQDKYEGFGGHDDHWPKDAGDWTFRYKSGYFGMTRTDWLENPNVKYNQISDAARATLCGLVPEIMAEALRRFPTLLEEAEVARAKDLEQRATRDVRETNAAWQAASKHRQETTRNRKKAETTLRRRRANHEAMTKAKA